MKFDMDLQLTHLRKINWCDLQIEAASRTSMNHGGGDKQTLATYKSMAVSVKMIPGRRSIDTENHDIQMELKYMRDNHHHNVNRFIGTCCEAPHMCVIMSYCKRGSLQDVLHEKSFNLSLSWRLAFAYDIAEGMKYLHDSRIISHGRLSSKNVVIDNQFVCKVTDYGLPLFRSGDARSLVMKDLGEMCVKYLYVAPEVLEMMDAPAIGTREGDVYAFGIIMNELALIAGPYSAEMTYLTPEDIVERVLDTENPPFRPTMSDGCECPTFWLETMNSCWDESAHIRPTFAKLSHTLHEHTDDRYKQESTEDRTFRMLEEHTTYLENLRNVKMKEKAELEQQFERLNSIADKVFSYVPRHVAEDMKKGIPIEPDCFDSVSIYVSDIVGFGPLIAVSKPTQIAKLLNKLYGIFERTVKQFDIYKIETLGNAYMLASGPSHNKGLLQAHNIAIFALTVMKEIEDFRIPHKPDTPILVRIGIHAGPCVGGVVGSQIPRYCLFGDTLTIATRLEEEGEPFKIHVSDAMGKLLNESGGFGLECRSRKHLVDLTGVKTYWLTSYSPIEEVPMTENITIFSKPVILKHGTRLSDVSTRLITINSRQMTEI